MAYSRLKQADVDPPTTAVSHGNLTSDTAPSSHHHVRSPTPLTLDFNQVPGETTPDDDPHVRSEYAESKVSKFISSLTSSSRHSYDLVEEDDYEVAQQQTTPTLRRPTNDQMATAPETFVAPDTQPDLPLRTASINRQLPLNHPKPDLQSIQGAYVKNVERLEESAEQLSMTSSLEEELQRMKEYQRHRERAASGSSQANSIRSSPQRRVSTKSLSNSIADVNSTARSGGYSPAGYVGSPVGSIRSPQNSHAATAANHRLSKSSKLSQALPEPELEGRPLDSDLMFSAPQAIPDLDPRPAHQRSTSNESHEERPTTSGSGDTYQQARNLFTDFDGVHYAPERNSRGPRRISLGRPPRARDSRMFKEPQPGEEMIFYPAPVPVMLNLPVRLSKLNWSEREKRRLQALSGIPDDMRKSAAWLANEEDIHQSHRKSLAGMPPQLRASAFFDHRGTSQDVELKDGSAVATLDSILDAAAHAPVSAFTDHPIAGDLGHDFYGTEQTQRKSMQLGDAVKAKRKSSMSNMLKTRRSSGNMSVTMARESRVPSMMLRKDHDGHFDDEAIEDEAERSIAPDADELPSPHDVHDHDYHDGEDAAAADDAEEGSEEESESRESLHRPGFSAAPTTLLAELQMRKAQQKMRNRTAVDAFPNGMHSTLLELDTVTQLQQKARRQKHVKLAWEDKDIVDKENFDDDDVPLGLLFPEKEKRSMVNLNRPLGLMEKKELEDNEPLSSRRARLRGEPLQPPAPARSPGVSQPGEQSDKPVLDLPSVDGPDDEGQEGETLGQRRQRMKERKEHGMSGEFAREVSSELGLKAEDGGLQPLASPPMLKTPDVEETLGQRRKRLQAEALNRNASGDSAGSKAGLRPKKSLADLLYSNPVGYVDPNENKTAQSALHSRQEAMRKEAAFRATHEASRTYAEGPQNVFGNGHQGGLLQTQAPAGTYQNYQQPYGPMAGAYLPGVNGPKTLPSSYGYQNGFAYPAQPMQPMQAMQYGQYPMQMGGTMGMPAMQMNYPYQYPALQSYGQSAMDLTAMGPPLDQKQRARIEGWRQGIM